MCQFEPRNPCFFDEPDEYNIYRYDPYFANNCWTLDRAVCFCDKDFCNGNYTLIKVSSFGGWLSGTLME
ncbi:hypothetical protein Aduo_017112 [Ancylostoma duodenale]